MNRHPRSDPHDRGHVAARRSPGLNEDRIFAATVFVPLRLAFATVNNALGATPDEALRAAAPAALRCAVADRLE